MGRVGGALVALLVVCVAGCAPSRGVAPESPPKPAPRGAPNVLFIAVDDLRPALGCYGDPHAISPHIDSLAARGVVFTRAYCQQAVCSPSRNGVLTGRRPDTIRIYDLETNFRTTLPDVITLPQHFKRNGYHAEAMGKIFHTGHGNYDDRASWSVASWNPGGGDAVRGERPASPSARGEGLAPSPLAGEGWGEGGRGSRTAQLRNSTLTFTPHPNPLPQGERGPEEDPHPNPLPEYRERGSDGERLAGATIRQLPTSRPTTRPAQRTPAERLAAKRRKGRAFAVRDVADDALPDGKIASHAIERMGALKEEGKPFFLAVGFHKPHLPFVAPRKYWELYDRAKLPKGEPASLPKGAPRYVGSNSGELRQYLGVPDTGPIPADLAATLVHGYYACVSYTDAQIGRVLAALDELGLRDDTIVVLWGDHGFQLGEHGLFCKHANFEAAVRSTLIVAAPGKQRAGARAEGLVEFVDIYPTLCELAGLGAPEGLEGTSFAPLLREPDRPWKSAAFSQWPKNIPGVGEGMGHSVRTDRYRLTEWTVPGKEYRAVELYDYETDPGETVNVANDPAHAEAVRKTLSILRNELRKAVPPKNSSPRI